MINHGNVQSTVKPQPFEVTTENVWVAENIQEVKTDDFEGFSYDLTQYSLQEYTLNSIESRVAMEKLLTDTQVAIVEIFESLVVV